MKVQTPVCFMCGKSSLVEVDPEAYRRWKDGVLIQNAFPDKSSDERELLMTGTHSECWDKLFADDEEE